MGSLGGDEITKIRGESFPSEGQKQPTSNETWSGLLWKQLKSPSVWVAATITALASLAVVLYLDYQANEKFKEENVHIARQLKVEIVGRSSQFLKYLGDIHQSGDVHSFSKLIEEIGPVKDRAYPMGYFNGYADASFISLLWELKSISIPNCFGDKILETAALSAIEILGIIDKNTLDGMPESKLDTWIGVVENKIELVLLVRFLDAKNKFSPPPSSGLSPELLEKINNIRRAECG